MQPSANHNSAASNDQPTVLLAEDEAMVRAVMVHMLGKLGYRVLTAADGRAAVDLFNLHRAEVDLVIFDMAMPTMGGEELFSNLKRIAPQVKTLLTSGYHERQAIDALMLQGLSGFLPKPFNIADMQGKLDDILGDSWLPDTDSSAN